MTVFTYRPVTITIEGEAIELEVCGSIELSGEVIIDCLYYKPSRSVYSKPMDDLLEIQFVKDLIINKILGRK
jgi:hypothetical protein